VVYAHGLLVMAHPCPSLVVHRQAGAAVVKSVERIRTLASRAEGLVRAGKPDAGS
jgi:hypothetical protein